MLTCPREVRQGAMRKTIEVEKVKSMVNHMLANSADDVTEGRIALAVLLERVLMETGNYHGYRHLRVDFECRIRRKVVYGDETRRVYY